MENEKNINPESVYERGDATMEDGRYAPPVPGYPLVEGEGVPRGKRVGLIKDDGNELNELG